METRTLYDISCLYFISFPWSYFKPVFRKPLLHTFFAFCSIIPPTLNHKPASTLSFSLMKKLSHQRASERDRETSQAIVLEDVEFPGRNSNGGFLSSPRFVQLEEIETVPLSGGSHRGKVFGGKLATKTNCH